GPSRGVSEQATGRMPVAGASEALTAPGWRRPAAARDGPRLPPLRSSSASLRQSASVWASPPFEGGEVLEAGGPPAGADRFDEFGGEAFLLHLARQGPVVVGHRAKSHAHVGAEPDVGIPDSRVAV